METKNKPLKKFKAGAISAIVWENQAQEGTYNTVLLERTYKDKQGKWQKSNSFRVNDLPKVELVARKAYEFLQIGDSDGEE